jgi:hypothetical protein
MKKILFLAVLATLLVSCTKKIVFLPQINVTGETAIQNHSEIWVYYNESSKQADVNKNNLITTTHWILNMDRRLSMAEITPIFQMVKAKRAKKSMHNAEGMRDYIGYSNTLDKNVSAFRIDSISYIMLPKSEMKTLNANNTCTIIDFKPNSIHINEKELTLEAWNTSVIDSIKGCIQLQYDQRISYQKYMEYRLSISKKLEIENIEYIYKTD